MPEYETATESRILERVRSLGRPAVAKAEVSQAKYVHAVLNSSLARWLRQRGEAISVPNISAAEQQPFIDLVDEILKGRAADPAADTEPLEWEIDRLVYDLYCLTEEEDTAVERALGLIHQTDEEEDAALLKMMLEVSTSDPSDFVSEEVIMETLRELRGD